MSYDKTRGPGRPERIFTAAEKAAILEGYREGESILQMARALRCCQKKVSRFLKSQGVQIRAGVPGRKQKAIELKNAGLSTKEIAARTGLAPTTVRKYVRPVGESTGNGNRQLSEAEIQAAIEEYKSGSSIAEVSGFLRRSPNTTSKILKTHGVKTRSRPNLRNSQVTQPEIQAAAEDYREGATLREVAGLLRVSKKTARRYLAMNGVKIRPKGTRALPENGPRTNKILRLSEKGLRIAEIAKTMNLSEEGVRYHLRRWASLKS